jgi:hypothetical protein
VTVWIRAPGLLRSSPGAARRQIVITLVAKTESSWIAVRLLRGTRTVA